MIDQLQFEIALNYFRDLDKIIREKVEPLKIEKNSGGGKDYTLNITIALVAADELEKYGRKGLEYLASKGFRMADAVRHGFSQFTVKNTEASSYGEVIYVSRDALEQTVRVLEAYIGIKRYETQVEDFRKLRTVEEAMKSFKEKKDGR